MPGIISIEILTKKLKNLKTYIAAINTVNIWENRELRDLFFKLVFVKSGMNAATTKAVYYIIFKDNIIIYLVLLVF